MYIAARKVPQLEEAAAQLNALGKASGGSCVHLQADLKDKAGCDALAKLIKERETKLDVLINNSGASWVSAVARFMSSGGRARRCKLAGSRAQPSA